MRGLRSHGEFGGNSGPNGANFSAGCRDGTRRGSVRIKRPCVEPRKGIWKEFAIKSNTVTFVGKSMALGGRDLQPGLGNTRRYVAPSSV